MGFFNWLKSMFRQNIPGMDDVAEVALDEVGVEVPEVDVPEIPTSAEEAKDAAAEAAGVDDLGPDIDPELEMAAEDAAGHAEMAHAMGAGGAQPQVEKPEGEPPATFEQYVDATTAQGVWASRGEDVNAKMQEHFGVDSSGFGAWAQYWGAMMAHDPSLGQRYASLSAEAQERWS